MPLARLLGRCVGVASIVVALLGAGGSSSRAQTPETPSPSPTPTGTSAEPRDQIVLSGTVTVRRGEEVGEVVLVHGTVDVAGIVRGDVVVLDGRILVTGQVSGSVVNIDGPVTIGPNAHILGDVIARDRIRVAEGALVDGEIRDGTAFVFRTPIDVFGAFATWLAVAVSALALASLLLLLAPRASENVAAVAASAPWRSAGIGVAVALGLPLLAVVTAVSLVGLPLGLSLLLALWFLSSVGFAWAIFALGRLLWRVPRSRWLALLLGWVVVAAISAVPFVGGVIWAVGAIGGLGAATLALWRARGERRGPDVMGGRHRPGAKVSGDREPQPLVTETVMRREGTGI